MAADSSHYYLGIDLGTTYSAMAYLDAKGRLVTIPNAEGEPTTPSVVLIEPTGEVIVGREAKRAALAEPDAVAECVKRDMGERYYSRTVNGKRLSPQAISALILKKLKQDAEARLGPVAGVVITVPAYFDEGRRQATIAAGQIAGFEVIDILNEPTAAALAYAYNRFIHRADSTEEALRLVEEVEKPHCAVVYDLGGGTFDVTVLRIEGNNLTVLATDGDVYLGGRDWDERIYNHAAELFREKHKTDPRKDPVSAQNLMAAAEDAKRNLSLRARTRFAINHAGQTMPYELTRDQFEDMTADLLYRTESRLTRVLNAAGMGWSQVDEALLVGGSTRMPQVADLLRRVSGKEPNTRLAPDEVVGHGAAIHAAIEVLQRRSGARQAPPSASPASTARQPVGGFEDESGNLLDTEDHAGQSTSPSEDSGMRPLTPEDIDDETTLGPTGGADSVHPEEGEQPARRARLDDTAEMPAPDLDSEVAESLEQVSTTNVNAHSLGVIMKTPLGRKVNSIIVPRNTRLPTSVTRRYGTVVANQSAVTVTVVEGEAENVEDCIQIGSCKISPLPWGLPRGSTIYVTFSYDNSGRLDVQAVEATSNTSAKATLLRDNVIRGDDLNKMKSAVKRIRVS